MSDLLQFLQLTPSAQSVDYVQNKKQFHLFSLLTEQRHPKTWNLSFTIQNDAEAGLKMLLSVDQDVSAKIDKLVSDPASLEQCAQAIVNAVNAGHRIYYYGCGATGRLAKQMESSFWKPFWRRVKKHALWAKLSQKLPQNIDDIVIGEMTGADRALVSSLEGFEDLQLIGKLQLEDHGIRKGDVVICVTEGGETSSVIGTVLTALRQWGPLKENEIADVRKHLYFVYNNPDNVLLPFERSATVINEPAITKINLTTGPQSITGSTRLQATTSETFVMGAVMEEAVYRLLKAHLTPAELSQLGFTKEVGIKERVASFHGVKAAVDAAATPMSKFLELEAETYKNKKFATYFAKRALITVFIDNTERSPTFRLYPLDRAQDTERHCWLQVWTEAKDAKEAWISFLGRPFRGLADSFYRKPFETEVSDPYLKEAALRSLVNAGNDQEFVYDFSFSGNNIAQKGPKPGDICVAVLVDDEMLEMEKPGSAFHQFADLAHSRGARVAAMAITEKNTTAGFCNVKSCLKPGDVFVPITMDTGDDPMEVRRHIALKMLLNAHSTGIMARLGRVIGNTMTNVSPSNLKLIGRATNLVLMHVNDTISRQDWISKNGPTKQVTFEEINAVLIDAMDYVRRNEFQQTAEVAMTIIRSLEALRKKTLVSWEEARQILDTEGLAAYLLKHNPALKSDGGKA